MISKAYRYYIVLSRGALFVLTKSNVNDFWAWLFRRVYDPNSRDFRNVVLAKYLFLAALNDGEHYRVTKVFRDYQADIEPKLTPDLREKLVYSTFVAETAKQQEIERSVLDILKSVPVLELESGD